MPSNTETETPKKKGQDKTPLSKKEPNWNILMDIFNKHYPRRRAGECFRMFEMTIEPAVPIITEKQFVRWAHQSHNMSQLEEDMAEKERIKGSREISDFIQDVVGKGMAFELAELEVLALSGKRKLLNQAVRIADEVGNGKSVSMKERYYANSIIDSTTKTVQKEKELAIRANKEMREDRNDFAKLIGGAAQGTLSIDDLKLVEAGTGERVTTDVEPIDVIENTDAGPSESEEDTE